MLFSPGWLTFALAGEGLLSANPWVQGGGLSDHLLQDDRRRCEEFVALGAPAEKIVMLGDPASDSLHAGLMRRDALRAELASFAGADPERPLALYSMPNDAEHGLCPMDEHIARQRRYLAEMKRSGVAVLVSLHPKSRVEDYAAILDEVGFACLDRPLKQALPAADIFVCSASSTILWAQYCGAPTVNLNYFRLEDDDFLDSPCVINIEDEAAVCDALEKARAAPQTPRFAAHVEQIRRQSLFDGKAGERLLGFFGALLENAEAEGARQR